jgi:hypothetical protein
VRYLPEVDAMESIHAVINALARRYAALDGARKATQVTRAVEGRKRNAVEMESRRVVDSKPVPKRSRRQGASREGGATTTEIANDQYDMAVADAVSFLEQIIETADDCTDAEDAERVTSFLDTGAEVIYCPKCKDAGTDAPVPQVLLPLHYLIVHSERGADMA